MAMKNPGNIGIDMGYPEVTDDMIFRCAFEERAKKEDYLAA